MRRGLLFFATGCLAVLLLGILPYTCAPILPQPFTEGSHGYRIWSNDIYKSFAHDGRRVCVPGGWEAVGATRIEHGSATFEKGATGVLIKTEAFGSRTIALPEHSYLLTLRYPLTLSEGAVNRYEEIVRNAHTRVGNLYPPTETPLPHTVLVTAGLAGDTKSLKTRVYPDPGPSLSAIVYSAGNSRGEELFIHATMHLYNRQSAPPYTEHQTPFAPGDFEEMEATWAELAFENAYSRNWRIEYLYRVHTAVHTNDFSLIDQPPFDDKEAFDALRKTLAVSEDSSWLDYQYGHYILAPLFMLAVDGLLEEHQAGSVEELLKEVHATNVNFMETLSKRLPEEDMNRLNAWATGADRIPLDLIEKGTARY